MLSGRNGVSAWNVDHNHALSAGGTDIDVVHAHARAAHDFYFFTRGQDLGRNFCFTSNDDGVNIDYRFFQIIERQFWAGVDLKMAVLAFEHADPGFADWIGNEDFKH